MAVEIHVATIQQYRVSSDGRVYTQSSDLARDGSDLSIQQRLQWDMEWRMVADDTIPNTASYPTLKTYLEAEAGDDFQFAAWNQNTVITQKIT